MQDDRRQILEHIAAIWNERAYSYAITHGLEQYPQRLGRDLDVLVARSHLRAAQQAALAIIQRHGWCARAIERPWATWIVAYDLQNDFVQALELDLFPRLQWGFAILADGPVGDVITNAGNFKVGVWGSFVKRILLQILGGDCERLSSRKHELELKKHEVKIIAAKLPRLVGEGLADELLAALTTGSIEELSMLRTPLRRRLLVTGLYQGPRKLLNAVRAWGVNEASQAFALNSAAPIVAVMGPDGVGKSSVLNVLQQEMQERLHFPAVHRRHWRPGVLPPLQHLLRRKQASSQQETTKPRRKSGRFSLLRCLYYAADYWIGTWWRDKRAVAKLQAVLYDRHALDMCVDPQRYGIAKMPQWLMRLLPQPDLLVVLRDTPARITDRKAELDESEIQRQLALWRELHRAGWVHHVIDTTVPPDKIAAKIQRLIIGFMLGDRRSQISAINQDVLSSRSSQRAITALNGDCVVNELA